MNANFGNMEECHTHAGTHTHSLTHTHTHPHTQRENTYTQSNKKNEQKHENPKRKQQKKNKVMALKIYDSYRCCNVRTNTNRADYISYLYI